MKQLALVGFLLVLVGIAAQNPDFGIKTPGKRVFGPGVTEKPVMNLPLALRQANWRGRNGSGSCVHASWISCLRWQGQYEWADWWAAHYDGGENYEEMVQRLDDAGIRWAGTVGEGNTAFLEWSCRTRRGCIVTWSPRHVVTLVHFDSKWAGILNNNEIDRIIWIPRDEFVQEWKSRGSWAMSPVYTPPPPLGS
jgi:hypothetical protein